MINDVSKDGKMIDKDVNMTYIVMSGNVRLVKGVFRTSGPEK